MTTDIRLWGVTDDGNLAQINQSKMNQEKRLEDWLEADITILASDILVIGRQVPTDYGGFIDLLCLDDIGDTVILELKRDKTPRETTAQALDYASWVQNLSHERITKIADEYFHKTESSFGLREAFAKKFDAELPETFNGNHAILIVGSQIDPASERIVQYLSDTYGVRINAATFQFFQDDHGKEYLARVFLIEPTQVEIRSDAAGTSKRKRNLKRSDFQKIAEDNEVGDLFDQLVTGLEQHLSPEPRITMFSFKGLAHGAKNTVINLVPSDSNSDSGLKFQIYMIRFANCFGINTDELRTILPSPLTTWKYYEAADEDWSGYQGYFKTIQEVKIFLHRLCEQANWEMSHPATPL